MGHTCCTDSLRIWIQSRMSTSVGDVCESTTWLSLTFLHSDHRVLLALWVMHIWPPDMFTGFQSHIKTLRVLTSWQSEFSHYLKNQPLRQPAGVLAVLFLILFPANAPGKPSENGSSIWTPASHLGDADGIPSFWLLSGLNSSFYNHLESEEADQRPIPPLFI